MVVAGCATGGSAGGGDTELPNRGFVPYEKVRDAEENVIPVLAAPLDAPCAVVDGDTLWLYAEACDGDDCHVERAGSTDGVSFGERTSVLDGARAPHVVRDGAAWRLAYVAADGRIGVARGDGGRFEGASTEVMGEAPSLAGESLYFVRDGAVWRAAVDGTGASAVMGGGEGCPDAFGGEEKCWDADGIVDAEVRQTTSATGRELYRMVYTGASGGVGFAVSADGSSWSRFAFNPVLPDRARGPTNVRFGDRYALYFGVGRADRFVVAAFNDDGAPSESF